MSNIPLQCSENKLCIWLKERCSFCLPAYTMFIYEAKLIQNGMQSNTKALFECSVYHQHLTKEQGAVMALKCILEAQKGL